MARLSRYLLGLFWAEAMALFAVAAFLLFLIQCLRLFDDLAQKGQSLLTLLGQAMLGMPELATAFLYVCLGIGLGRTLRNLQASNELQIAHVSGLLPALMRAIGLYLGIGVVAVLLLAHVVTPWSQRTLHGWGAAIAADVVSRSLVPHKMVDLSSNVSVTLDARDSSGNIAGFFADDDRKPDARRTYFAKSAIITRDAQGFVLRMHDGAIQQFNQQSHFSEVRFATYDLNLDDLTGQPNAGAGVQDTTLALAADAIAAHAWTPELVDALSWRSIEALRVLAICLLVTVLGVFPSGARGGFNAPIEFIVLGAAFLERGFGTYAPLSGALAPASGPIVLAILAGIALLIRLRAFRPLPRRRTA